MLGDTMPLSELVRPIIFIVILYDTLYCTRHPEISAVLGFYFAQLSVGVQGPANRNTISTSQLHNIIESRVLPTWMNSGTRVLPKTMTKIK